MGCSSGSTPTAPAPSSVPAPSTAPAPSTPPSTTTAPRTAAPRTAVTSTTAPSTAAPSTSAVTTTTALPPVPVAGVAGTCPYLSGDDVAQINGEKTLGVEITAAVAPADPPACFFYTYRDQQQLSTWVFRASSPAQATAAVNRAAPVESTDPANQPTGWIGGSKGGSGGAVYAVAKGPIAVVVTSNQDQSVKARRAAEQIIGRLGL